MRGLKPERVLSARELNRALLARQLLLERSGLPMVKALEQIGGLQTQYAPSGYIGLWTRLRDFRRDSLTQALEERRVVQATLMRVTIHTVSARDYPLLTEAVRSARRDQYLRLYGHVISKQELEGVAARARELLSAGPLRRDELVKKLGVSNQVWYGVGLWVDLVRVPPSGTWERRRADLYTTADAWLGAWKAKPDEGLRHLVHRYLSGFGPARVKDIASWGGIPAATVSAVLDGMKLATYRDEEGAVLYDLPGAPLPDPSTPAPVRFLPTFEAILMVHARQANVLAEKHRPVIFNTKTPHSVGTFLVDGSVAGKWTVERGRIVTDSFVPLKGAAKKEVAEEAGRLTDFHS
jgi:hypothetical protein